MPESRIILYKKLSQYSSYLFQYSFRGVIYTSIELKLLKYSNVIYKESFL